MKQTLTKEDLDIISGKFIIEIDNDKPVRLNNLKGQELDFYLVKRVRRIAINETEIISSDVFGNSSKLPINKFINNFNDVEGKTNRHHRILYAKELDVLFNYLKRLNY